MADNELLIKINADAKNAQKAFDDIKEKSSDLEDQLSKVAKISAVGFAALTAEVGFSVKAFADAEAESRRLTQSLQAQGIAAEQVAIQTASGVTEVVGITEAYKSYADEIERVTGIDGDAITSAQAVTQGFLGQTKVTKELSQAIADLAVGQRIDLNTAAQLIGRTIGTQTNAFARQGVVISDTATKQERLAAVLDFVNGKYKGQAEAANQGLGSIKGLEAAFGNLQKAIGERFAPAVEAGIKALTTLFNSIKDSPEIVNFTAALIAGGLAVTGIATALPIAAQAFLTLRAAVQAAGIAMTGTRLAVRALIGATGIGLLVIAVTELALHWDTVFPRMRAVAIGFVEFISGAFKGLSQVLSGALTLDINRINEGLANLKDAYKTGISEATKELPDATKKALTEQDAVQASFAAKQRSREAREADVRARLRENENELIRLQLTQGSQAVIDIKKQEIEILKQLQTNQNAEQIELLNARYEQLLAIEADQRAQDLERKTAYAEEDKAAQAELDQLNIDSKRVLRDQDRVELEASLLSQKEVERKIAVETIQERIKNRNIELEDRKKYGIAISTINEVLRTTEVQNAKAVSGELVGLAQSKNATLKAIGKAASIANITISTAESAATLSAKVIQALPFPINVPVAAALAAARIAYGAEQIATVQGAQSGALVEGGIPGRDSVPFLLEPGELVTPRKNFEEVVNGVNAVRSGGVGSPDVLAALQSIDNKLTQPHQTIIQGDVLADSTFIDTLVQKINDRLEFGNARFVTSGA